MKQLESSIKNIIWNYEFEISKPDENCISAFVEGIKIEWHWRSSAIKLGYGNSLDDKNNIREYIEQNITGDIKVSNSGVISIYKHPTVEQYENVVSVFSQHNITLGTPVRPRRRGLVRFDQRNAYYKVAELIEFLVERGLPDLISRGGGILDRIDSVAIVGRSRNSEPDNYREHVVPCDFLMREAIERYRIMKRQNNVDLNKISDFIEEYNKIVLISNSEARIIDIDLGLRTNMPSDWRFDDPNSSIFARLDNAGIIFDLY